MEPLFGGALSFSATRSTRLHLTRATMNGNVLIEFVAVGGVFCVGAILAFGLPPRWWRSAKTASGLTNTGFFFFDAVAVAPLVAVAAATLAALVPSLLQIPQHWPLAVQFFIAVFLSDLAGYCRHRLLHTRALWPAHAVHHSDHHVHWLTLVRVHPLERFANAAFDSVALSMVGFDPAIVAANNLLRHYYGYVLHADIRSDGGLLRYIFVTPHLHRWHHSDQESARDKNFAVIFSFIDLAGGTFYCPKKGAQSFGNDDIPERAGFVSLLLMPFKLWAADLHSVASRLRQRAPDAADSAKHSSERSRAADTMRVV